MMTNRYGPAVAAVLPILLASSVVAHAQTPESRQELRGSIRIVGTDTMKQLMDRWIAGFTAIHPEVKLDLDQLDAIWCTTLRRGGKRQITEWGELGLTGDWSHRPINLIGVLPPDGVPNFITRRVCNGGLLHYGIHGEKNGEPTSVLTRIVQDVAKDPNAIGYAGFHNRQPGTHPIQIADAAAGPFYEGTFDEVRSAVYPLTRFVYIYLDRPPDRPLDPPIRKFLSYILSLDGQRKVEEEGIFMPLPPLIAAQQRAKLE